jgi:hypothetical protein
MQQFSEFVYLWLNMFRALYRPSSETYNCTRSLWFCTSCRLKNVALLVVTWQDMKACVCSCSVSRLYGFATRSTLKSEQTFCEYILQLAAFAKPETTSAVVCFWWWAVRRLKHVEPQVNELRKLLHFVGWSFNKLIDFTQKCIKS